MTGHLYEEFHNKGLKFSNCSSRLGTALLLPIGGLQFSSRDGRLQHTEQLSQLLVRSTRRAKYMVEIPTQGHETHPLLNGVIGPSPETKAHCLL